MGAQSVLSEDCAFRNKTGLKKRGRASWGLWGFTNTLINRDKAGICTCLLTMLQGTITKMFSRYSNDLQIHKNLNQQK